MLRRVFAWVGIVLSVLLPVPGFADHKATNRQPHPNGNGNTIVCQGTGYFRLRGAFGWTLGADLTLDARAQADLGDAGDGLSGVMQLDWRF
jgi:hypothetical protein